MPDVEPAVHDGVLFGADEFVAEWVRQRIVGMNGRSFGACAALGIVRDGKIVGGVVFNNWHKASRDIDATVAVAAGFRASPSTIKRLLRYPFVQLQCGRVTVTTGRTNRRARHLALRMGFKLEGVKRRAYDGWQDAMIYGLLVEDCRQLKGERDEQRA